MEILATKTHYFEYIFVLILLTGVFAVALGLTINLIVSYIKDGVTSLLLTLVLSTVSLMITALSCLILITASKEGPVKHYMAKIEDFNEVYNNGYEIVRKEENLYIIKESREP